MSLIPALSDGEQRVFFKAGGEWCYLWTPVFFRRDRVMPVVIHHHGARGFVRESSADWLDEAQKASYLRAVMEGGRCAVAGSHACGDHWGNPCSVAANKGLYDALASSGHFDMDRVGLMGGGLGGALVWNSVLGPLAGRVRAVAVMQGVVSLADVIREQKFKAACLAAYGLPADTADEEAVKRVVSSDPLVGLRRLVPGSRLPRAGIFHGARDANIPAGTNAVPLAEALRKAGGDVVLDLFPDVEHSTYAMGKPMEEKLRAFFAASL